MICGRSSRPGRRASSLTKRRTNFATAMLRSLIQPLRQQWTTTHAGGAVFQHTVRTARRKHLRIAARKKKELENQQKKKSAVVEKKEFVPYHMRLLLAAGPPEREEDRLARLLQVEPKDNVWLQRYFTRQLNSFEDALTWHRETCDPSVFDSPSTTVNLHLELDARTDKKTKFLESFSGIFRMPHPLQEDAARQVAAVVKDPGEQEKARIAGASLVLSGTEFANMMMEGELSHDSFDTFVSHTDSILELLKCRGLFKLKFPDKKRGTLGVDTGAMVDLFARGTTYAATKQFLLKSHAYLTMPIGRLDMPAEHIVANIRALHDSLHASRKASFTWPLVSLADLSVDASKEKFKFDIYQCVGTAKAE